MNRPVNLNRNLNTVSVSTIMPLMKKDAGWYQLISLTTSKAEYAGNVVPKNLLVRIAVGMNCAKLTPVESIHKELVEPGSPYLFG